MLKLICILYWTRCSLALVSPVHRRSQTHHGVQLQMSTVQTLAPKVREHKLPVIDIDADVKSSSFPPLRSKRSVKTIPSGQSQIPVHIRIIKAIWEECAPWILSFLAPSILSLYHHDFSPLRSYILVELSFFLTCTVKVLKFNEPVTPEPLVGRSWEETAHKIWDSQPTIEDKKKYLMGWFYDADFQDLREEDAISFLAWMRYGLPIEEGVLTTEEVHALENFDLPLLVRHLNQNIPLPTRSATEKPLAHIRFNCEPLRYRHKGIIFYTVTHGIDLILSTVLRQNGYVYTPSTQLDLGYWCRAPSCDKTQCKNPIIFIHGVGGMAFTWKLIEDIQAATGKDDTPIILLDLPHVSLRIYDSIPKIEHQINSISRLIESAAEKMSCHNKAIFVGHSFGTTLMSWMIQKRPDLVGGCVFLDPICFQLHLKTTLFNFHMQRVDEEIQRGRPWVNPFSVGSLINMAGTEFHTNYAMLRQFSWASNILWPSDLDGIPSYILLSENDEIVPVREIEKVFGLHRKKSRVKLADTHVFKGACHGDVFMDEGMRSLAVKKVFDVLESSQKRPTIQVVPSKSKRR